MNEIITEKKYSVQNLWILKSVLGSLFTLIFFIPYFIFSSQTNEINENLEINLYIIIIIGFAFFHLIITILKKINFHYSIGDKFLTLKQGILSKQQRNIPYEVIQNIFVKQDLFDRIFRLSSLTIENASYDTRHLITSKRQLQQQQIEMPGFFGNKVSIPGLTKQSAEILKEIILQKMKENPIEDSQSGL